MEEFPYRSLIAAVRDKYAKLGGPAQAFLYMKQGYNQRLWRRKWDQRRKEREAKEDSNSNAPALSAFRSLLRRPQR